MKQRNAVWKIDINRSLWIGIKSVGGGGADITGSSSDLQVGRCGDQPGFSGLCSTNNLPKRSNKHTSQAIAARMSWTFTYKHYISHSDLLLLLVGVLKLCFKPRNSASHYAERFFSVHRWQKQPQDSAATLFVDHCIELFLFIVLTQHTSFWQAQRRVRNCRGSSPSLSYVFFLLTRFKQSFLLKASFCRRARTG